MLLLHDFHAPNTALRCVPKIYKNTNIVKLQIFNNNSLSFHFSAKHLIESMHFSLYLRIFCFIENGFFILEIVICLKLFQ